MMLLPRIARAELTRRIMSRGDGGSRLRPGDPLRGQPARHLTQLAGQAAAGACALDRAHLDAVRVDTDGRTAAEAADLVAAATRWPGEAGPDLPDHATWPASGPAAPHASSI
jgi:hypothetical protein